MTGRRFWPGLILAYFTFHTVYRALLGGGLGLDEAEMFLQAQEFRWGYGPQLPLYGWLQHTVFLVAGPSLFSLSLFKNALLCGMVLTLYGILRTRFIPMTAGPVALSLLLLPQIAWESQRSLTHSVLVSLCAMLCLAALWWIARRPSTAGFVCLGLVLAAGGLAKYNFYLMPAAAALAILSLPDMRESFRDKRLILSLVIAALLLAWPYWWIYQNPQLAFATATKLRVEEHLSLLTRAAKGLLAIGAGTLNFLLLPTVVVGALWGFRRNGQTAPPNDLERLLRRTVLFGMVLLAVAIVLAGGTNFRDRWLQPLLIFSAPALVLWLLPRLTGQGRRALLRVYGVIAAVVVLGLPVHYFRNDADVAAPFPTLVPQMEAYLQTPETAIIAHQWLAGNILYVAPHLTLINEAYAEVRPDPDGDYVLVWKEDDPAEGARRLAEYFPDRPGWSLVDHKVLRAPFRFDADEIMTLSIARVATR
ncbi:glycosyltransferase family 39 protein [Sulfitobacter sp. D35]|uniref:ArnT family glycosyltransferase n=1 Tax=Sulfitobacter sp. D35 TaxID=3083252 RepID=UPI00296F884F|nr:glycosyltransferase family 39 protein [Sulfitobacter sp. D35]MDW4497399.1 glycosyltransferase family 39 protein [Sulfitobacter sp. D35]